MGVFLSSTVKERESYPPKMRKNHRETRRSKRRVCDQTDACSCKQGGRLHLAGSGHPLLCDTRLHSRSGFGPTGEGHIRLSFGATEKELEKAFDRMEEWGIQYRKKTEKDSFREMNGTLRAC